PLRVISSRATTRHLHSTLPPPLLFLSSFISTPPIYSSSSSPPSSTLHPFTPLHSSSPEESLPRYTPELSPPAFTPTDAADQTHTQSNTQTGKHSCIKTHTHSLSTPRRPACESA